MTTFQAIVYGIVHGFTELLPLGAGAHRWALSEVLLWPAPDAAVLAGLLGGSALAVFFYFIHDWASILSSFFQIIFFRRKPMTLDERMPFFLLIASAPSVGLWYYLKYGSELAVLDLSPSIIAGSIGGFALLLLLGESLTRRTKNLFDWNWVDALIVGLFQAAALAPGVGMALGRSTAAVSAGLLRNYSREAAAKFSLLAALPLLTAETVVTWMEREPLAGSASFQTSWLTFGTTLAVSTVVGLLAIGGLMRGIQRKGFRGYAIYRGVAAAGMVAYFWFRAS